MFAYRNLSPSLDARLGYCQRWAFIGDNYRRWFFIDYRYHATIIWFIVYRYYRLCNIFAITDKLLSR